MSVLNTVMTFDIDVQNNLIHKNSQYRIVDCISDLLTYLDLSLSLRATWFIRIDNNIKHNWGTYDYIFKKLAPFIKSFETEHELGWHLHSYVKKNGIWQQNTEIKSIIDEIDDIMPIVKKLKLSSFRMGWGFQSNEIIEKLSENGILVDSSAIPRPQYPWDVTYKDWSITPDNPYFPSKKDYRIPGSPAHSILEVPISVTNIKAPYDTIKNMLRYINLAYHPSLIKPSLDKWIKENRFLITITHPYEVLPCRKKHDLLSFSLESFNENIKNIIEISKKYEKKVMFLTMSEFAYTIIEEYQ